MDHPESIIRAKTFHPVPVLSGFTRDEVTIWFTKCRLQKSTMLVFSTLMGHYLYNISIIRELVGPTTKTKDLRSFVQVDVVSLLENIPTVTQANMAAMIHSVTVQYLYRAGIGENDTLGKTSSVSDVCQTFIQHYLFTSSLCPKRRFLQFFIRM